MILDLFCIMKRDNYIFVLLCTLGNQWICDEGAAWFANATYESLLQRIVDREDLRCSTPHKGRPLIPVMEVIEVTRVSFFFFPFSTSTILTDPHLKRPPPLSIYRLRHNNNNNEDDAWGDRDCGRSAGSWWCANASWSTS